MGIVSKAERTRVTPVCGPFPSFFPASTHRRSPDVSHLRSYDKTRNTSSTQPLPIHLPTPSSLPTATNHLPGPRSVVRHGVVGGVVRHLKPRSRNIYGFTLPRRKRRREHVVVQSRDYSGQPRPRGRTSPSPPSLSITYPSTQRRVTPFPDLQQPRLLQLSLVVMRGIDS